MSSSYDLIVIGAGPGGYVAAIRAAQLGMNVACIDRRSSLGGTCLNVGCIPSKALLDSSEHYQQAQNHFKEHGINIEKIELDLKAMLKRKDKVVTRLTKGVASLFKKNKIDFHQGTAQIKAQGKVQVDDKELNAKRILIATGSEPISLPSVDFDGKHIVSSTEALTFDKVPEHFIVVGGGYIGLEMGSVWSRLGAKVTVVEFLPRIVPPSDHEMGTLLHKSLSKQGFEFHLETKVESASVDGDQVTLKATSNGEELTLTGDKVLLAVGRRPHTEGLGLEEVGVDVDSKSGEITVDGEWQTNVEGIYAIGDVVAGPRLAHKAEDEGIAVVERMVGQKAEVNYDAIPSVIYTWPELASVGKTEEQLKESNHDYRVGKFVFQANGRAIAMGETEGLVKILADTKTDRVLGAHIFGPRASDLIAECVNVIEFQGSSEDIAQICHAHPTLSEAVREAAFAVDKRAIHS